jgi:hypothetical protein
VVLAVATVIVDEPPLVTEAGLKLTLASLGAPEALRLTVCAAPEVIAVPIVEVVDPPCVTLPLLGVAEIEKSLATTVSANVVVWVAEVPVPVTVIV